MLISIDKTKELTRKEYVDFLQKTKGENISEARISQLVSAGRLKVRDYPELNNLQLIVLDDDEQALAQARFTTTQALHTYSYKELGLMFGKLIHDLNNDNGNAQTLLGEKQAQLEAVIATLQQVETERNQALEQANRLSADVAQLIQVNGQLQADLVDRQDQLEASQKELTKLNESLADIQRKLDIETSFRNEFGDFKSLIMNLLRQQSGVNVVSEKVDEPVKPGKGKNAAKPKQ